MDKYDDIIKLPHHVSDYHKPMPMANRAAQFAPFAALTGYEEAIYETARMTEGLKELSEEEKTLLSMKLNYAMEHNSLIEISYFIPDKTKSGGSYKKINGRIKKWDEIEKIIVVDKRIKIPVEFIYEIKILGAQNIS